MAIEAFFLKNPVVAGSGRKVTFRKPSKEVKNMGKKKGSAWKTLVKRYGVIGAKARYHKHASNPTVKKFSYFKPSVGKKVTVGSYFKHNPKMVSVTRPTSYTIPARKIKAGSYSQLRWTPTERTQIISLKKSMARGVKGTKGYRFAANPVAGMMSMVKETFSLNGLKEAAPYGVGILAAWAIPPLVLPKIAKTLENKGFVGYLSNIASAIIVASAAGIVTRKWDIAGKIALGGLGATLVRVVVDLLPKQIPIQVSFQSGMTGLGQANLKKAIEAEVEKELKRSGLMGFSALDVQKAAAQGVTLADETVTPRVLRYEQPNYYY